MGALAYTCHFNVVEIARELRRDRGAATSGVGRDAVDAVDATNAPDRTSSPAPNAAREKANAPRRRGDDSRRRVARGVSVLRGVRRFPWGTWGSGGSVSGDVLTEWIGAAASLGLAQIAVAGVNVLKYPLMGFALRGASFAAADDAYARVAGNRGRARRRMPDERSLVAARLTASLLEDAEDAEEASDASRGETARRETSHAVPALRDGASNEKTDGAPPFVRAAALFATHASIASCAVTLRRLSLALDLVGATCARDRGVHRPGMGAVVLARKSDERLAADGGETARLRDRVLAACARRRGRGDERVRPPPPSRRK